MKVFFIALIITIFTLGVGLSPALPYSSPDIPVGSWSYEVVEKLAISGLVSISGIDTKPMTRVQMAYKVKEAMDSIDEERVSCRLAMDREYVEYLQTLLYKLINEFRQELIQIGATTAQLESKEDPSFLDENVNFNPASPVQTENRFVSVKSRKDLLLENENGLRLANGYNLRTRANSWVNLFDTVTFSARPEFRFAENVSQLFLDEAAAKASISNVEFSMAKSAMWWGPGFHGSLLMSNNAEPLNLIRVRSINNFRFPGMFEKIGTFGGNFFISKLEKDRVYPDPTFMGLRLEWSPLPNLSLGATRTDISGGKGRPKMRFKDYWDLLIGRGENEFSRDSEVKDRDTDQLASLDAKLAIPLGYSFLGASGLEVYAEWAGEDKFALWDNESPGVLAGFLLTDLLREEGADFRFEYARNKPAWYVHGIYNVTGSNLAYAYKDEIMGHHMGGDAEDYFFRLSKEIPFLHTPYFNSVKAGIQLDLERHRISQPNPERLIELVLDVLWQHSDAVSFFLSYEFEDYRNFNYVVGKTTQNSIVSANFSLKF